MTDQTVEWAKELQSIAQAGLFYGKDDFDRERYRRIRQIAAEMMAVRTDLPLETLTELFCSDTGYQTPKIDTRAVIIRQNQILLVRERTGTWSIPGGWCEYNLSPAANAVKEAGADVTVKKLIAVHDRDKHNPHPYPFGVVKLFFLCEMTGGQFAANIETSESGWFAFEELPPLSEEKSSREQIKLCFDAYQAEHWVVPFD